jgi:hypothetical protein
MHDPLTYLICGVLLGTPISVWFGLQIGQERERLRWEKWILAGGTDSKGNTQDPPPPGSGA